MFKNTVSSSLSDIYAVKKPAVKQIPQSPPHSLVMENKNKISLTGVKDVENYDDTLITVVVGNSVLSIKGFNLHISKLSLETGEVAAEGEIISLAYSGERISKGNLFARIFK